MDIQIAAPNPNQTPTPTTIHRSTKRHSLGIAAVCVITLVVAVGLVAYHQSRRPSPNTISSFSQKSQAYDFVTFWGTYGPGNYGQYATTLRSRLTPDYYTSKFGGDLLAQQQEQVTESESNIMTTPLGSVDAVAIRDSKPSGFEAMVQAQEETIISPSENYFDQVTYHVTFVKTKQSNKYLVSNVVAERAAEQSGQAD